LFGDVIEIAGLADNLAHNKLEFEDGGVVALKMQNEIIGSINWSVNTSKENTFTSFTIIAENGTITLNGDNLNNLTQNLTEENIPSVLSGNKQGAETPNKKMYYRPIYDQLEKVLNNEGSFPTAIDGLQTVQTIEKIYKALGLPSYHSV
jgi:predicted dehydrogenase